MSFVPSSSRARALTAGAVGLVLVVGGLLFLRMRASSGLDESLTMTETTPQTTEGISDGAASSSDQGTVETSSLVASGPIDRDGDGLSDEEERSLGTDPLLRDTDGDGVSDEQEVAQGSNPLILPARTIPTEPMPEPAPVPPPQAPPAVLDQDADGLSDEEELMFGTNPQAADTDGDGFGDAQEIEKGYNPLGSGLCVRPDCRI